LPFETVFVLAAAFGAGLVDAMAGGGGFVRGVFLVVVSALIARTAWDTLRAGT
jgi:hypothetical protein